MSIKNKISIVVASDNHYAILIVALLKSIDENHKTGEHIDFHVIDDGIKEAFWVKFKPSINPDRITLKIHKSRDANPGKLKIPVDSSSFPLTSYLRIFSPYVVDDTIEKLLYLDVDTLVLEDISKLWNQDLGSYTLAAVQDVGKTVDCSWGGIPNYKELGLTADTKYFNAGVILINPKKWRSENVTQELLSVLEKYKQHVKLVDQYALNVVFANKWKELDPNWNWFALQPNPHPYIVHFLDIKPIFTTYNSQESFRNLFFKYLNMTPWENFKPINGNRRFFRKLVTKAKKVLMRI